MAGAIGTAGMEITGALEKTDCTDRRVAQRTFLACSSLQSLSSFRIRTGTPSRYGWKASAGDAEATADVGVMGDAEATDVKGAVALSNAKGKPAMAVMAEKRVTAGERVMAGMVAGVATSHS